MHADRLFRLLHHATLAASCICLLNAEQTFLPAVHWFMLPIVVVVFAGWRSEGRWRLPAWAANLLGLALIGAFILLVRWLLQEERSWLQSAPMPAGIVPLLGPLLIGLLLVRLFRPRVAGDFWVLQSFGALQVGLACVIGTGPELGLLLPLYLGCALGCLVEHHLVSGQAKASTSVGALVPAHIPAVGGQPGRRGGTAIIGVRLGRFLLLWLPLVGASAVLLFLLMPRPEVTEWVRPGGSYGGVQSAPLKQSGYLSGIDLGPTGWVDLSSDPAFRVTAVGDNGPVVDLPMEQRWRFRVLDTYNDGLWRSSAPMKPGALSREAPLMNLGPGQVHLTFTVKPHDAGGLFLADPIRFGRGMKPQVPVRLLEPQRRRPHFYEELGTLLPREPDEWQVYTYEQVFIPARPNRGQGPDRAPVGNLQPGYLLYLVGQQGQLLRLTEWTVNLLRRMATEPRYELQQLVAPGPEGSTRGFVIDAEDWERVGRALAQYLATSGDYTYTLELQRKDLALDPALDFLWNIKAGPCDRYAAGLTLMLRSLGIPARVVKGYKGLYHEGGGHYVVRQNQAHSWVEVLVPSNVPAGLEWLTLDPTPDRDAVGAESFSLARLLEKSQRNGQLFWEELILGYNSSSRADLMERLPLPSWSTIGTAAASVLAAVALLFLWRRRRQRGSRPLSHRSADRFYARLLTLVQKYLGLSPSPGQTPRVFAQSAERELRDRGADAVADIPAEVVDGLYKARFGGVPVSAEAAARMDARLSTLKRRMKDESGAI